MSLASNLSAAGKFVRAVSAYSWRRSAGESFSEIVVARKVVKLLDDFERLFARGLEKGCQARWHAICKKKVKS